MRVSRWGDNLAVRLPADLVESLALKEGDEITIRISGDGQLALSRVPARVDLVRAVEQLSKPVDPEFRFRRSDAYPDPE